MNNKVSIIKGIGSKQEYFLNNMGIYTISDLLLYFPYRYEEYKYTSILNLHDDSKVCVKAKIKSSFVNTKYRKNLSSMVCKIEVEGLPLRVIVFNQSFLRYQIHVNDEVMIVGKYLPSKKEISASKIFVSNLEERIEPVYSLKEIPLSSFRRFIKTALDSYGMDIEDNLPMDLQLIYKLPNLYELLNLIHFPKNKDDVNRALRRLKFEEFLIYSLKILSVKSLKNSTIKQNVNYDIYKVKKYIESLPFSLTNDQKNVTNEIFKDILSPNPLNRIIQGDVGCGKTIVASIVNYAYYLAKYQSVLMAPTEILAREHYETYQKYFQNTDVKIGLLIGSLKASEKKDMLNKIKNHDVDIIIGTHALIQENVEYANLGLAIIDEQHRFGVIQRMYLQDKYEGLDMLYLTATPIPRSLALCMYEDISISSIKEKPAERIPIITEIVGNILDEELLERMKIEMLKKHQIFVVTPAIFDSENFKHETVYETKDILSNIFSEAKIGILHSKLSTAEKKRVSNEFESGNLDILVSTTIVEVGINIKNATLMVIVDAYMFGLSQLHQLRGRVGRSDLQSYCYLVSDEDSERLNIIKSSLDGFYLSEKDLELRGPGKLLGFEQSGENEFKFSNFIYDFNILKVAKDDAKIMYQSFLSDPHSAYRKYVKLALENLEYKGFLLH